MTASPFQTVALIGAFRQSCAPTTIAAITKAVETVVLHHPEDLQDTAHLGWKNTKSYQSLRDCLRENFQHHIPIVALCASGIVIRALADLLHDKYSESPVLVVAEDGSCVIPMLGGHRGGNELARKISDALDIAPAITTASDQSLGFALDMPPKDWKIRHYTEINPIMARLLAKQPVQLIQEFPNAAFPPKQVFQEQSAPYTVRVTDQAVEESDKTVILHPPSLILGIGCERRCPAEAVEELVMQTLNDHQLATDSIAAIATVNLKADEPALHALADRLNVPIKLFSPQELEALSDKVQYPSDTVFQEIGCHSVAEAAALACTEAAAQQIVPKVKNQKATLSIVRRQDFTELAGRELGSLSVVGTGPGDTNNQTQALEKLLKNCNISIGYGLYLDLVANMIGHTEQIRSPLGEEQKRVEQAIAKAQEGHHVALICSGDPGIYALATLVYEVLEQQEARPQFRFAIHPGITAMQAAAAKLGAPLGHDFLAISLSDLLTPPETIRMRLHAAGAGDFVTSIYNPQSRTRRTLLPEAKEIFLQYRSKKTPVAICRNIGRPEEEFIISTLADFDPEKVDMLSLVMIGNSMTRATKNMSKTYLYTPRGYIEPINTHKNSKE